MFKTLEPSKEMVAAREAVLQALDPFKHQLSGLELLTIASYVVGQLLAFQDQKIPHEVYMEVVAKNIEAGNAQAIEQLFKNTGGMQ